MQLLLYVLAITEGDSHASAPLRNCYREAILMQLLLAVLFQATAR